MTNRKPADYLSLITCSYNGTLASGGFKSGYQLTNAYSCINVSALIKSVGGTINIYTNSIKSNTYETLYFTISISANQPFYKRFIIPNSFFRVELIQSSGTPDGYINVSLNSNNQFSSYTFLNSPIALNPDTHLTRVANDYQLDLIRGVHNEYTKVNINGRLFDLPAPSVSEVIGLDTVYRYQGTNGTNLRMTNANDTTTGTGARTIRVIGILQDGSPFNSLYGTIGNSVGSAGLNIRVVNRIIIESVGSAGALQGDVFLEDSVSGEVLGKIHAQEGSSRSAIYAVEANKQLVIKDINICAYAPQGEIQVNEYNPSTNIIYTLGNFFVNTNYQQLTYSLNALIPAGNIIQVSFSNTSSVPAGSTCSINVNINGILCPLVNTF